MKVFFSLLVTFPMIWVLISLYIPSGSTIGRLASPFTVSLMEGKEIRLRDFRDKVVVINFWASWCPPCQKEAKGLEAVWRKHKNKDVLFLGINVQNDEESDARRYVKRFGITYPNGWDDGTISKKYNVFGIPKTFILAPKGKITYIHLGAMRSVHLPAKIGEAHKGVVTDQEGRGPSQSLNVVRIEELARLLETSRSTDKLPPQQRTAEEESRKISIDAVSSYKGRWIRIIFKNGTQREGKILAVKKQVIQLEEILNVGSFTFHVPIQQIQEVQLLIFDDRADNRGSR